MTIGVSLGNVPNPEVEVYRNSLLNWLRFNHRDLPNALIYVGVCAALLLLAWAGDAVFNHFLVNHYTACGTIGCHPTHGTLPPYHGSGPSIPPFR